MRYTPHRHINLIAVYGRRRVGLFFFQPAYDIVSQNEGNLIKMDMNELKYPAKISPKIRFWTEIFGGTDRQVGALYRFRNVRSGIDALVSITAITGGLTSKEKL
jgi:hypothetical protein